MAWIAKDEFSLTLFEEKPFREQQGSYWNSKGSSRVLIIEDEKEKWLFTDYDFNELSWEDEPIEVEVQIKRK